MSIIDLGDEDKIEVKYKGASYELREPTVNDAKVFKKKMEKNSDDMDCFVDFISELGLPKEISKSLGLSKIKKLSDGILGNLEGKK